MHAQTNCKGTEDTPYDWETPRELAISRKLEQGLELSEVALMLLL